MRTVPRMATLLPVLAALLSMAPAPAGPYRTLNDRFPPPRFASRGAWEQRAAYLREHVLASAGLLPLPEKAPLHPVVFDELKRPDHIVAKVYFESLPGFYVTGNLYRPIGVGPFPAVLSPHGHWPYGRLENTAIASGPARAINLARLGFVVFSYDMVGYDDSRQLTHRFGGRRETLWGLSLAGLQLWNSIRSLDFLESLPYVRRDAIGATGESGGGTQTFLLAAADPRVAAAVPVNMISLHMQGGCLCENPPGLRLDTTNVEIAATIAPRPLLMVSATGDWTNETLEAEYPAVRALYALVGADDRVSAVRFDAPHNYNKDSREAMYAWMGRWLKQLPADARPAEVTVSPAALPDLLVFHRRPLPEGALSAESLTSQWIDAARRQLAATSLEVRASALRHALAPEAESHPAGGKADAEQADGAKATRRGRPVVLVAGETGKVEGMLRAAGYSVRSIAFTPFDAQAAAKVEHFETYNRTAASQRVADIVAALRAAPGAVLVAAGDAALAGALASAIVGPRLAILDVKGFDTSRDDQFVDRLYIPGLRRAGDLQTASELAPGILVFHGAGAQFAASGARVQQATLTPAEILALVRQAPKVRGGLVGASAAAAASRRAHDGGGPVERVRNNKVAVVEQALAPGESERPATRAAILVYLDAGSVAVTGSDGKTRRVKVRRGDGVYDPAQAGTVQNAGRSPLRIVRVEYLGKGSAERWGSSGLSSNYKVLAEDRFARVYDIRIAAGGTEPQHTHHDRVVICLSGAELEHVMPDGRRETSSLETDAAVWRRGGTHVGRNLGKTDLWAIAVEPK